MLDAGWEAPVQLTSAQIDQYLNDRKSRGFSAIIIELVTQLFSNQQPTYQNAYGNNPFSIINNSGSPNFVATTCDFSSTVNAYWQNVDYLIEGLQRRGMCAVAFPAYAGFPSTSEGWYGPFTGDTTGHLQTYGAFLANRYGNCGNIIWAMSGDNTLSQADLDQQWNIITGMRSVRTDQLIYAKAQRNTSGWSMLTTNGGLARYPGFNVNNAYVSNNPGTSYTQVTDCLAEYGRSPTVPFFMDEQTYEGRAGLSAKDIRYPMYCGLCSGQAWGGSYGNDVIEVFGSPNNGTTVMTAQQALDGFLNTTGSQHAGIFSTFALSKPMYTLVPHSDTSLVTTSLGSDASPICPALSADGSLAVIYTGAGTGFTIDRTAMSLSSFQAKWFDPTNGSYMTDAASPMPNSGTHAFSTPGNNSAGDTDWVLMLST